jgi:GAF domain-containing protein
MSHTKGGQYVPVELSAFAVRDEAGKPRCFVGVKRDVTARKRAEDRLTAEHAVTRILAEARSLEEAAPAIVQAVRQSLHARVGELWLPDDEAGVTRCAEVNCVDDDARCRAFGEQSRTFTFGPGIGLPGRVWQTRAPAWIVDVQRDPNFPRAAIARAAGLRSGMAFPIMSGEEFFGVMEFFTDVPLEPDPGLLSMMGAIGSDIGQFIRRRRAEDQLLRSQADLQDFVENATGSSSGPTRPSWTCSATRAGSTSAATSPSSTPTGP